MNKRGFTLIEIVMVLVLLGILAAVAVPKYFDLKSKAEEQTAKAVAAEFQARINGKFAEELLAGTACKTARDTAITEAADLFTGDDQKAHGFDVVDGKKPTAASTGSVAELQLKKGDDTYKPSKIALPVCAAAATGA